MEAFEEREGGILLRVKVQPRASRNAIGGVSGGRLSVALTAPPVNDEANKALTAFLVKTLGLPKRSVILAAGARSRHKILRIENCGLGTLREKLGI